MSENRMLLALQYWSGDALFANDLGRFIADLEPVRSPLADVLLVCRHDAQMNDALAQYLGRKFNVYTYKAREGRVGWPDGCNDLWFETIRWVRSQIGAGLVPQYKCVFTFEADGVPVVADWISRFSRAWDDAGVKVLGAELQEPGLHINGNAMFSCDRLFLGEVLNNVHLVPNRAGWDYALAEFFRSRGVKNLPNLRSYWKTRTMRPVQAQAEVKAGTWYIHGVKDRSLLTWARAQVFEKNRCRNAAKLQIV